MIRIEPLRRSHYEQYEGESPEHTMRGLAALDGDQVIGICAVVKIPGESVVMFDINDASCMQVKRALVKGWAKLKPLLKGRCVAVRDQGKPTSMDFLTHFGFVPEGDVYVYRGDQWAG